MNANMTGFRWSSEIFASLCRTISYQNKCSKEHAGLAKCYPLYPSHIVSLLSMGNLEMGNDVFILFFV